LFAISSGFGRHNSIPLLFLTSSSVILLGFSFRAGRYKIQAQQQALHVSGKRKKHSLL